MYVIHETSSNVCLIVIYCIGECSAGYYCDWGSSSPEQSLCPAGFYCPTGTPKPLACTSGTFSSVMGNSHRENCEPCPVGFFCQGEGQGLSVSYLFFMKNMLWVYVFCKCIVIVPIPLQHRGRSVRPSSLSTRTFLPIRYSTGDSVPLPSRNRAAPVWGSQYRWMFTMSFRSDWPLYPFLFRKIPHKFGKTLHLFMPVWFVWCQSRQVLRSAWSLRAHRELPGWISLPFRCHQSKWHWKHGIHCYF